MRIPTNKLIKAIKSKSYSERWFAAEILGTKKTLNKHQIREISREMMTSDVGEVLCWGLGQMKNKNYISKIGKLLEYRDNYFKCRAADALTNISNSEAIGTLEFYLKKSKFSETRWRCAVALGEIGDIHSFDSLWNSAQDKDKYVRWKSIWALSLLKGNLEKRIREKILDEGTSEYMLWRCLWVLGRIGNRGTGSWLNNINWANKHKSKYIDFQLQLTLAAINNKL